MRKKLIVLFFGVFVFCGSFPVNAEERPMGFFVTSVGMGNGADLGGEGGSGALR